MSDCAEQVAISATNVENRGSRAAALRVKISAEPCQNRTVTEERRVEPGKIAQNRLEFCRVDIVAVEPFVFMAALPEIEALSGRLGHRARGLITRTEDALFGFRDTRLK